MDREIAWSAVAALAGVVGLVACLSLAEELEANWLYVPAIAFLFAALLAGEVALWGLRSVTVLVAVLGGVVLGAFVVERVS